MTESFSAWDNSFSNTTDAPDRPAIGRGTGMTMKEFNERLDAFMEERGMEGKRWGHGSLPGYPAGLREPARSDLASHSTDPWEII